MSKKQNGWVSIYEYIARTGCNRRTAYRRVKAGWLEKKVVKQRTWVREKDAIPPRTIGKTRPDPDAGGWAIGEPMPVAGIRPDGSFAVDPPAAAAMPEPTPARRLHEAAKDTYR